MLRRAVVLLVVGLAGCLPDRDSELRLPEDVDLYAVLHPSGGSPLAEISAQRRFAVAHAGVEPTIVVGYSWSQIEPLLGSPDQRAALDVVPLRFADATEPLLPAPLWAASIDSGGASEVDVSGLAPLTADWLGGDCPRLQTDPPEAPAVSIETRCGSLFRCPPELLRQLGCKVTLDLSACFGEVVQLTGQVDRRGEIRFADSEPCVDAESEFGEIGAARCELETDPGCVILIHRSPPPEPPPFLVETRQIATDGFDGQIGLDGSVDLALVQTGVLSNPIVVGDRLFIAHGPRTDAACSGVSAWTLTGLDLDTLEPVSSATVPGCLWRLSPMPNGDGLAAIMTADRGARAVRFSADGQMIGEGRVIPPPPEAGLPDVDLGMRAVTLSVEAHRGGFSALLAPSAERSRYFWSYFVRLDADLSVVSHLTFRDDDPDDGVEPTGVRVSAGTAFAFADRDISLLLDDGSRNAIWIEESGDYSLTNLRQRVPDISLLLESKGIKSVHMLEPGRALIGLGDLAPAIARVEIGQPQGLTGTAQVYEVAATPGAIAAWDERTRLVVLRERAAPGVGVYLALFDIEDFRFLPGAVRIAEHWGPVHEPAVDRAGRVFLSFPWSGVVARISRP